MSEKLSPPLNIIKLLGPSFSEAIGSAILLSGGKNNQSWKISAKDKNFVLKVFPSTVNGKERFHRERAFLSVLQPQQLSFVPTLCEDNEQELFLLLEFVPGEMLVDINSEDIEAAASFIADINRPDILSDAQTLHHAKDAYTHVHHFFEDIQARIKRLHACPVGNDLDRALHHWLVSDVVPLEQKLRQQFDSSFFDSVLEPCLSPSDFGFHNAMRGRQLVFFDFEYAGWDGAEKLITDFFAQPRFQIPQAMVPEFVNIAFPGEKSAELARRATDLLPLAHFKWALIFLNEFLIEKDVNRQFSQNVEDLETRKLIQWNKSKAKIKLINCVVK